MKDAAQSEDFVKPTPEQESEHDRRMAEAGRRNAPRLKRAAEEAPKQPEPTNARKSVPKPR